MSRQASGARARRLGRLAAVWAVVLVLDAIAMAGVGRLVFEDSLERTFESDLPRYAEYRAFQHDFPGHGQEAYVLVESAGFETPGQLEAVADFVLELQLADGVAAAVSPFSLVYRDAAGQPASLLPPGPLSPPALARHIENMRALQPGLSRFLSADRRRMVVALQLEEHGIGPAVFDRIRGLADRILGPAGLTHTLTGFPVMRQAVVERLFFDFITLDLLGALAGTIVAAVALGSVIMALFIAFAAGHALLWQMGLMGFMGTTINVVTVSLPVLIVVLAYADAVHLSLQTRHGTRRGIPYPGIDAARKLGPACLVAAATTAIAFGALSLSPSSLVAEMGLTGSLGVLVASAAVLVVAPLVFTSLQMAGLLAQVVGRPPRPGRFSRIGLFAALPRLALRFPRMVFFGAVAALVGAMGLYAAAEPNFSLYDNIRDNDALRDAAQKIEESFGPIGGLHFATRVPPDDPLPVIEAAAGQLSSIAGSDVVSLASFARSIPVEDLPEPLRRRFLSQEGDRALLTIPFKYRDARETRRIALDLEARLAAAQPVSGARIEPHALGMEAMTSFVSAVMLRDLNRTFVLAVVVSGLLIALWLRDPLAGVLALVPNLLPIALVGAVLTLSGRGLEIPSGIALTIAFGLAIDDTVHVLNRQRLNLGGRVWGSPRQTLRATAEVAPALVITSAVLGFGLLGTQLASLPSVALFGQLSIAVFVLALIADLLILPACLIVGGQWLSRSRGAGGLLRSRSKRAKSAE